VIRERRGGGEVGDKETRETREQGERERGRGGERERGRKTMTNDQ
jgi:hypothetical protein